MPIGKNTIWFKNSHTNLMAVSYFDVIAIPNCKLVTTSKMLFSHLNIKGVLKIDKLQV